MPHETASEKGESQAAWSKIVCSIAEELQILQGRARLSPARRAADAKWKRRARDRRALPLLGRGKGEGERAPYLLSGTNNEMLTHEGLVSDLAFEIRRLI